MHGVWHDQAHRSHLSQEFRSLVISRWCHSALYGCLMHDFLREVSHGSLARVHVLCWHSGCRALEALRARGSPPSHSILPALNSSVTDLPCPFWRKASNFRGLFAFLLCRVATIKLAYNVFYP